MADGTGKCDRGGRGTRGERFPGAERLAVVELIGRDRADLWRSGQPGPIVGGEGGNFGGTRKQGHHSGLTVDSVPRQHEVRSDPAVRTVIIADVAPGAAVRLALVAE